MANLRATPRETPISPTPAVASATGIGDPGPLGLSGFALTVFLLSLVNTGIVPSLDTKVVLGVAILYGGLAQLLAGMWAFRTGNTFGATAFTAYGAFWLSFAALLIPGLVGFPGLDRTTSASAMGWYMIAWAIITIIFLLGALRINGALTAVFALLFLTFLLVGLGALGGNSTLVRIGGWLGILSAIVAWYTALAGILSTVSRGSIRLPVYPMGDLNLP